MVLMFHPCRKEAPASHHGDGNGQDHRGLPDLLEAPVEPLEHDRRASQAAHPVPERNILIDDPKDKTFTPFGDARHKIESGEIAKAGKCISPSTRRWPRTSAARGFFRDYPPDFFDLIIVDECHRGSARDDSSWRVILEHFKPAYQLGMTATPLREDNRDTYLYFGNPIYEYSLRQGIDDGFLAPYRVQRRHPMGRRRMAAQQGRGGSFWPCDPR